MANLSEKPNLRDFQSKEYAGHCPDQSYSPLSSMAAKNAMQKLGLSEGRKF